MSSQANYQYRMRLYSGRTGDKLQKTMFGPMQCDMAGGGMGWKGPNRGSSSFGVIKQLHRVLKRSDGRLGGIVWKAGFRLFSVKRALSKRPDSQSCLSTGALA